MMKRAANILLNPVVKTFSGPVVGFMVGGIAFAAHMQYEMAAVLGLGAVMVTWWLTAGCSPSLISHFIYNECAIQS